MRHSTRVDSSKHNIDDTYCKALNEKHGDATCRNECVKCVCTDDEHGGSGVAIATSTPIEESLVSITQQDVSLRMYSRGGLSFLVLANFNSVLLRLTIDLVNLLSTGKAYAHELVSTDGTLTGRHTLTHLPESGRLRLR